jgi:hypothetical protein
VDKISKSIAGFINNSKGAQRVLRGIGKNPAIFSATAAFGLASVIRPKVLEILPFKDDKDRKASQATALASGLSDLLATAAIFIPLNKGIEKAAQVLLSNKGTFFGGNKSAVSQFKSITNRGAKLLFLVPLSIFRVHLVKPLLENINKKEKKRKIDKWA